MKKIQSVNIANWLHKKFFMKKMVLRNYISMAFVMVVFSLLFNACRKETIPLNKIQSEDNTNLTEATLHPTGVILDDPATVAKVGYYKIDIGLINNLASSVDLSGKMPQVGNQGSQGSCVGWAVGYYGKTYQEVVEKGWNATENAYSPSWVYNQINGGRDEGSRISDAMDLLVDDGCDFKDNFPYSSSNYTTKPDAGSKVNSAHYKSSSWKYLSKNVSDFKALLASSQVVIISIPVYPDFDNLRTGNEIYDNWSGTSRGNHAICIVGYDDHRQAFKFINSWGTGWGLSGYGWIAYSKIPSINNAYLLSDKANAYDTKYLVGDFNGDTKQDIFTTNGYGWYVSWGGVSGLKKINSSGTTTGSMKIADFNGDGRSDIFYPAGGEWKVSWSGTGKWTVINTSNTTAASLEIGDFNGDGKSDVFYPYGGEWKVSWSGTGRWTVINTSNTTAASLQIGDFNGDGQSDVFYPYGGQWKVSYSGTSLWAVINTSGTTASNLEIGDFNGDGKADVFYPYGGEWKISYSGISRWTVINTSNTTAADLEIGDFNGDGKSDVFHALTARWEVSWSGTSKWDVL